MGKDDTAKYIESQWESWFVPALSDFIDVPNLTLMVDPEYGTNGLREKAMEQVDGMINKLGVKGLSKKIYYSDEGMPIIAYVVEPSEGVKTEVMIYGHLDKQPYGFGWWDHLKPDKAFRDKKDGRDLLYGRGGADDGYAPFTAMLAVKAAQE